MNDAQVRVRLKDPETLGNYTVDELQELAQCKFTKDKDAFRENSAQDHRRRRYAGIPID